MNGSHSIPALHFAHSEYLSRCVISELCYDDRCIFVVYLRGYLDSRYASAEEGPEESNVHAECYKSDLLVVFLEHKRSFDLVSEVFL